MRDNIMMIENFFKLTNLKDGFTDPAQVEEIFAIIVQDEDDKVSVAKKVDVDSTHQWSTIARAITTTDNQECLDAFAQLDKLRYIDKSLLNAQKIGTETGDALVKDLLRVLDKLQIDKHNLVPSGIWTTVGNIAQNDNNAMIQERAKALVFDKWKEEVKSDSVCVQDIEIAACVNEKGLNGGENSAEHLGDQQKLVDIETSENSLNHAMKMKDTEQMHNSSDILIVALLEQRDEIPKSATDVTNASSHSVSEEDIDTKAEDPCLNKDSVHSSDTLQVSGVVGEVIEQVNNGAENDRDGAEIVVSPQRSSPDTGKGEEERNTGGPHNKTQAGSDGSTEAFSMAEEPVTGAKNLSVESGSCIQELFSPSAMTYQEHNIDKVNESCGLDLNQQVSSEDKQADILLKQQGFVGFDLNLAEGSDDEHIIIETQSEPRHIVTSSKCTHFDLNRIYDDDSDSNIRSQPPSSASSSSRIFDLNNVPFLENSDDGRVIKIMGTRVILDTPKFVPQTLSLAQANIQNPRTPGALGFGSEASCYVDLVPGLAAFYGPEASAIPCASSSSASTVPYVSTGIAVDLNSDPGFMEEGVNICTTGGLFSGRGGNEFFRGTKRKVADSQWSIDYCLFKKK